MRTDGIAARPGALGGVAIPLRGDEDPDDYELHPLNGIVLRSL